ncbi:CopG family transcriptional regulator [Acinetobacter bereziniae]|uniref:ribbon-helix-helix domain-containing protein n=1 Tax=Acinetobacter bereziniae TaxID=106648 RepID=UPI00300AE2F6
MSTEKTPLIISRAPKLNAPREERIAIYLPQDEVAEIDSLATKTNRSRSSIIGERYFLGKQTQAKE